MDKYGDVDLNWYSTEAQKRERENAEQVLKEFKELEKLYKKFRTVIVEKTEYGGIRKRYVKKDHGQGKTRIN